MSEMTLSDIAEKMADIDFVMLSTRAEGGEIASRPMSNNGDVEYDGDSHYFAWEQSRMVADIERDAKVGLSFQGDKGLFGKPPLMIAIEGEAELIRDKQAFEAHWRKELERWFTEGVETVGLVLIKVHATRLHYWNGEDQGEVPV